MKKNKKYFPPLIILMISFLLIVFALLKFGFGEYVVLTYWFWICGKNVCGYFCDGEMFAFGSSNILKKEKDDEGRILVFYLTLVAYFFFLTLAFFQYPWRNFFYAIRI